MPLTIMPLDLLERFGAACSRVWIGEEQEQRQSSGGELSAQVERMGLSVLGGLFFENPEITAIELEDPEVGLRVERRAQALLVKVSWASGERFEEPLALAPSAALQTHSGAWVRPSGQELDLRAALRSGQALLLSQSPSGLQAHSAGRIGDRDMGPGAQPLLASIPALAQLGSAAFCARLGIHHAYVAGAMAGGISSPALVIAMARAGQIAFFGAGGLPLEATETALQEIRGALEPGQAYGANLLHNPMEPSAELATVDLYLKMGVRVVSASAFMGLTPALMKYRYAGIRQEGGEILCPNTLLAKISRPEVARHFLAPPPASMLERAVADGLLSQSEATLAAQLPMADALTCEADSGGHTDRRPLPVLLPMILAQRDAAASAGQRHVFVGAAGGLGTPASIVGALAMGAEYVLTGSVNQCTVEAGTSTIAKEMLLSAGMADFGQGPAPDMFELGAHVQVLARGTMYAKRGARLYGIYQGYSGWEEVPEADRMKVEKQILGAPFQEIWESTERYWQERDPAQVSRAQESGRHKMALVFRWYLGMASRWARVGDKARKRDFQIWSGPSMGAFNAWVSGSSLEPLENRRVADIAAALISGSLQLSRARALQAQGVELPLNALDTSPA